MKDGGRSRRILHIDLHPFFVAVERSRDASLRSRPVVVGGMGPFGRVAAASEEARACGIQEGQSLAEARRRCPDAVVRPGDLEAYASVSEELTSILLRVSHRVERPSGDEAFVDLSSVPSARHAVLATESLKDAIQSRLDLDAAFGLASCRLAARIASRWARPRGLLLLLPDHEASFLAQQPLRVLDNVPAATLQSLMPLGIETIGQLVAADGSVLAAAIGRAAADRLREQLDPARESPIALATPPTFVQEDLTLHDRSTDRQALDDLMKGLAERAGRRLVPHDLRAGQVTVEIRRGARTLTRSARVGPASRDVATLQAAARRLAGPLLDPAPLVRTLRLRLTQLTGAPPQACLFPEIVA
jgi:DNA polymerase-4